MNRHRSFALLCGIMLLTVLSVAYTSGQSVLEDIISPGRLPYLKKSKLIQISSADVTGGNDDRATLRAGEAKTIARMDGPGVVTRIWITIGARDPYFLRKMVLRIFWDGEKEPSVEAPIGDFFGTGFGYRHYLSQFIGMSSGGYYCYFPMPFNKSGRIDVTNESDQEVQSLYYHIDYQRLEKTFEPDVAYFHAQWRRNPRTSDPHNYTILDATGQGHYVGVVMNMQGYDGTLEYLEGDEMIYVDGERNPSIKGTGTEDYFTGGWYFNRGEFAGAYHGVILKDDSLARIACYRFHVGDAIPFRKSISVTIEHGHANTKLADYSSVAFWYQKEPHRAFGAFPHAALRIPLRTLVPQGALEAESLKTAGGRIEKMDKYGADWSGLAQLRYDPKEGDEGYDLILPRAVERSYRLDLYYTRGPEYGNGEVHYADTKVGEIEGYNPTVVPGAIASIANVRPVGGKIPLRLVAGNKDARASGNAIGIDAIVMEPERQFIADWHLLGPFPNPRTADERRLGLDTVFAPERKIDLTESYVGLDGNEIEWTRGSADATGFVDLGALLTPHELTVAYALTYVHSPDERTVPLMLGSDDGVKVFLNGETAHRHAVLRGAVPDQDRVMLKLVEGWNTLLLKIENNIGGYGFYARVVDPDDALVISADQQR